MKCPECGCGGIEVADDWLHDLFLLSCKACGLAFAASKRDVYAMELSEAETLVVIQADWDMAYAQRPKLL